jgi:serine/threonine protein kinase
MSAIPKGIGPYEFRADLGSGAFSQVKLAFHRPTFTYVACKVISRDRLNTPELQQKFEHELRIMVHLQHPGIVRLVDLLQDELFFYVFLDLCAEGDLFSFIVDHKTVRESEARVLMKQILSAVQYMHERDVAHRDLKPENILIDSARQLRVKIADFGLSKLVGATELTGTMSGSPSYVAPEVLAGGSYDARKSDAWSAGVILYTMVAGNVPWSGDQLPQIFAQIQQGEYTTPTFLSDQCRDLIRRLLCVIPDRRLSIPDALRHPWLADAPAPPPGEVAPIRRPVTVEEVEMFFGQRKGRISPQQSASLIGALPVLGRAAEKVRKLDPDVVAGRKALRQSLRRRTNFRAVTVLSAQARANPTRSNIW